MEGSREGACLPARRGGYRGRRCRAMLGRMRLLETLLLDCIEMGAAKRLHRQRENRIPGPDRVALQPRRCDQRAGDRIKRQSAPPPRDLPCRQHDDRQGKA